MKRIEGNGKKTEEVTMTEAELFQQRCSDTPRQGTAPSHWLAPRLFPIRLIKRNKGCPAEFACERTNSDSCRHTLRR
ncbi:hypothetical protein E2C01_042112 [Portunus trituberculatus]|uniref:Uncharacterized protein n=1 Tax=Portunus trituberculatus TaxID=210409 RepID=A0A5B7FTR3_PORTR|nr:hypothetical protein [Portunus trituberculatus]